MSYKKELLYEVANLYYAEDLKQDSIARRLNISSYKVSRVLRSARDVEIVKIQVENPCKPESKDI
jgi:deoxyribonucleoside regulator